MRKALAAAALAAALVSAPAFGADIASAAYGEPTDRYPHGALGDRIEYGTLNVVAANGSSHSVRLEDGSVFEDIAPRLADIDGDGQREAWVIRANARDGARLEAYAIVDGALALRFQGPAIGLGFRWLNPVAIADFDGDGRNEAAYVETPHIGGILTILEPIGERLEIVTRQTGYSNHAIGSTRLDLAAALDVDGDGAAEIILPNQVRDRMAVVSFSGGRLIERWRSARTAGIAGGVIATVEGKMLTIRHLKPDGTEGEVRAPIVDLSPLP